VSIKQKAYLIFEIQIVIEPDENGFHAYCPDFKGLHIYGDTEQEALANAKNAIIAYLKSLIKHNDLTPLPKKVICKWIIPPNQTCKIIRIKS
jgi:predicted RNase H-like HicB family nuclease